MKEIIDIENIYINKISTDEQENREVEKNRDLLTDHYSSQKNNNEIQFHESLTPKKDNKIQNKIDDCILCRDYSSPICSNCKNRFLLVNERKESEKIIPNGKVKALAKRFEDISPGNKNSDVEFECNLEPERIDVVAELECKKEIVQKKNANIENLDMLENISNVSSNISTNSTTASFNKTKKEIAIKDPDLCGSIDPIQAIIDSSKIQYEKTNFCLYMEQKESTDLGVDKMYISENDKIIFDEFESLDATQQRTLLLSWITTILMKLNFDISQEDNKEIFKILKELLTDLELNQDNSNYKQDLENGIKSESVGCKLNNLNSRTQLSNLSIAKTKNDSIYQINIGIPEDKEIEEDYIIEYISKSSNFEDVTDYSITIDGNKISPKSEISLTDDFDRKNYIKNIANEFFGFN